MLTQDQRAEFDATGLLRLPQTFTTAQAAGMRERIWTFLADRDAVARDDRSSWPAQQPTGFQPLTHTGAFRAIRTDGLCAALDGLLGTGRWTRPRWWGRPLVTFPSNGPWELPTRGWHFDFMPARPGPRPVQFFALLDRLRPGGGGTLVLTGSHRLVGPYLSQGTDFRMGRVRDALATRPALRGLWEPGADRDQRYMRDSAVVDGVPLRVVELTGEAGDVFLMHCDCFHTAAPNCSDRPRMMATEMVAPDSDRATKHEQSND